MIPSINTKMITLLGKPLSQSSASLMQNTAYQSAGMNMIYFYTEVDNPKDLGEIIQGIRHMNFAGFAVTKPNKVDVLQFLDDLDPLCRKMGSSNTVVKTPEGKLIGYNTDGLGFYRSLQEFGVDAEGKTFFCIGTGGAGRAMCSVLAYNGAAKIYLMDIDTNSAKDLEKDINEYFAPIAEAVDYGDFSKVSEAQAVLNASGIGMGSHIGENPMPKEYFSKDQVYFDACYNPAKTQFLLDAEEVGARILNGLDMSLYQGAAQIELWTGKPAPVEVMRNTLQNMLAHE